MAAYRDVVVDDWEVLGYEPMGSKPDKLWLQAPATGPVDPERRWLFKPATTQHERDREYRKGDDWAEKIAAGIAILLGVPAAPVELATRRGTPGILSGDVSGGRQLVLGNEVLYGQDPDYDLHRRRGVPGYTVTAVFAALRHLGVEPPAGATGGDVWAVFAGYLLLDALVANTDRHHENWGILVDPAGQEPPSWRPPSTTPPVWASSSPTRSGSSGSPPVTATGPSPPTPTGAGVGTSPAPPAWWTWPWVPSTPAAGSLVTAPVRWSGH